MQSRSTSGRDEGNSPGPTLPQRKISLAKLAWMD
jgi:hypothetical protein